MKDLKRVEVKSRKELRKWLAANHQQQESIWLVTYKKSNPKWYLDYGAIVEEALCFGWIDSLPRALDEHRRMLRLSPRKPKSSWSKINRGRVSKLIQEGLMTEPGLKAVKTAKKNGSWDRLKSTDNNSIPPDLNIQLKKYPKAIEHFARFPPSSKRAILEWIAQAKKPETRKKRVEETARLAAKNIRANHYRQPEGK